MKKVLLLALAILMVFAMAVSAAADGLGVGTFDPASAGDYEFSFAWWGNQVRDEVTKNAADYFTQNYPNITFNLNAQSWNNYWALMSTNAANNDLPDVMQQDYAYIEQWVEAGDLLDLTPYVESGALDLSSMPQNIIDTGKVGDGLYAVCCAVNAPAMLYNKTLTDSLGIEIPMNITWDEFAEISRTIYEKTGIGTIYGDGNSENPLTYYVRSLGYTALWDENGLLATAEEMAGYYARLIDGVKEGWLYDTDKLAGVNTNDLAQYPLVYGSSNEVRCRGRHRTGHLHLAVQRSCEVQLHEARSVLRRDDGHQEPRPGGRLPELSDERCAGQHYSARRARRAAVHRRRFRDR